MARNGAIERSGSARATVAYARFVVRARWWVALASLLATLALAAGAQFLRIDAEYRVWFGKDNPELRAFEAVQNVFSANDSTLFVIAPKGGDVFTPQVLAAVEDLTREAWTMPHSRRVDSITNFQHTRADGDELIVADLVKNGSAKTPQELARIREIALAEPALARRLVSARGHVTGVNVTFQFPRHSEDARRQAAAAARALRDRIKAAHPDLDVRLTGLAMLDIAFSEAGEADAASLTPIMFGIIALLLIVLLRSLAATVMALAIVVLSAAAAMGAAGWLGIAINPATATAPTIIMTLAVADSVHLLATMRHERGAGRTAHEALIESLRINFQPVVLTSVTTAVGFLSMNFSDAPPFRDLGNVAAIGVMVALALSVTLLPAVAAIVPPRGAKPVSADGRPPAFRRLAEFVIRRQTALFWGVGLVVIALGVASARIELDDDFINYFDRSIEFRRDTDFMTANLSGLDTLEFAIGAAEKGGIADPAYLRDLERLTTWLRNQPEVVHVSVLTDTMKRINKSMHGDDPSYYRVPENRELAAQYLLLYELSLPFGLNLNDTIDLDKSTTRLIVTLKSLKQKEMRATAARIEAWIAGNLPKAMHAAATGPSIMFANISARNIRSMLSGTSLALILISVLLIFAFRSMRHGAISLIPNLVPAIMAFGLWGLMVRQVDVAVSVIAAISLGIVVDDTIHFLSKYLRARRERGVSAEDAVRYAFVSVGPALTVTTAVLVAGFMVLALSPFAINARMGLMTAIAIAFALAVDFLLLPPLLLKLERNRHEPTAPLR